MAPGQVTQQNAAYYKLGPRRMASALKESMLFALIVFVLLLAIDALLSVVFQPPPLAAQRVSFLVAHGIFLGAALVLSATGALLGFVVGHPRMPPRRVTVLVAPAFALTTILAGPGSFMLAGRLGAAAWLLLGSMSFALGSTLFRRPWQAPAL